MATPQEDDDVAPAPPSIGADIPLTYFGPAPSDVQKELIGPHQLLKAGKVDLDAGTITLPLYKGKMRDGRTVWYIVTDTSDKYNADALGLNHSPKLAYTSIGRGTRNGTLEGSDKGPILVFDSGTVDFSPKHAVTPGDAPNYFPPKDFQPGSVGDNEYSPLVRVANVGNHVYNAPMMAFDVDADTLNAFCDSDADHDIVHDKVLRICPEEGIPFFFFFLLPLFFFFLHPFPPPPNQHVGGPTPGGGGFKIFWEGGLFCFFGGWFFFPIEQKKRGGGGQGEGCWRVVFFGGGRFGGLGGVPPFPTPLTPFLGF